jgi:mediator of RNA polymerase II transcription subunit 25
MMAGAPQRPPFDNIEAARQQNLAKIQHLRQTLEAAQQQELQYKSQLEVSQNVDTFSRWTFCYRLIST